jgi:L-methionine (R)-S-oxide reductase
MLTDDKLEGRYQRIYDQLSSLLPITDSPISQMATVTALLHHKMRHFFWTGFYILLHQELTVGPYQGPLACQVLERNQGVCWSAILQGSTLVVPDVHKFSGHIGCDSRSNSEIALPLFDENRKPWAVLDIDSRRYNAFSEIDRKWLEKIGALIKPVKNPFL